MTIWTIIGFLLLMVSQERIAGIFYGERKTSRRAMVCVYLLAVVSFMLFAFSRTISGWIAPAGWEEPPVVAMILAFLMRLAPPFIITLSYKSSLVKRLAVVGSYLLVTQILDGFLYPLFFFIDVFASVDVMPFLELILGVSYCLAILLLRYLLKHIKKDILDLPKVWIPALFVPIAILSFGIFSSFDLADTSVTMYIEALHSTLLLLGTAFMTFSFYNVIAKTYQDKLALDLRTQEKEYYLTQCQIMQESVDKMKAYRHDVKLHLAALKDFTANNKANEATDYLNHLLGDVKESEVYSDTGNLAFDSIINFKLKDIIDGHINLQLKIFVPPTLNMEVVDVVTILGNLLDNAFDAVAKVEDKMISLSVEANKGNLFIKIENTFDGKVKYTEGRAGEDKVIASRKQVGNHGYGLQNIRKSVEKYDGHMDISYDETIFSVGILLYVDRK